MVDEPRRPRTISADWVLKRIQEGKKVRLKNAIIKGDLVVDEPSSASKNLTKKTKIDSITSQIKINNSQIDGTVYFMNTIFKELVDFSDTKFSASANFVRVAFEGETIFSKTKFIEDAIFGESTFNEITYFNGATFSGKAYFGYSKFSRYADFSGATFGGEAIFSVVAFRDFAGFGKTTFSGNARFITTTFASVTDFGEATFSEKGLANFSASRFDHVVNFNATFHGRLVLDNSKIYSMFLSEATITSKISLNFSEFSRLKVRWESIRNKIEYDGTAYLALVRNFNNLQLFDDADECYYEYRTIRRKKHLKGIVTKLLDYVAWIAYGYGVRPGNPLILSLGLLLISIFVFVSGFGLQEPLGSIINATYLSVFVFTSSPKTDPLTGLYGIWGMIERIAGLLLMACFLVVLAKKTLR